ncbi:NAD-dependent epimerase/dehydratase family protein [Allosalinactinospora lopnorensis]|uniref:NAD-dependent epimerase/dehydratase family protein n=1 Tax=Allosalinactinospora lopnorensis TaxID=1352348 RepID=UPI000623E029|nr:NAD-dependent epimerase/dehydratase family protein [Allosalinactinospora lopnorensis]
MARVVLVTGVSRYLGSRVAEGLQADPGVDRVIGVDSEPPRYPFGSVEFAYANLCDGSVGQVIRDSGADTVLHLGLVPAPEAADGKGPLQESNVVGTMQLLAACQQSAAVRRVVLRSSAAVDARDVVEMEEHTRGLARRRPDLSIAVLRFANLIGPSVETPLTRYLGLRIVPTVKGYDPRMQFIHEDDGVEVLRRMALGSGQAFNGFFNVAAPGAMPLSQCLHRVGRPGIPVPERGLRVIGSLARRGRGHYSPDRLRRLCCGRVLETGKVERTLDWAPAYTSRQAFESFAAGRGSERFEEAEPPSPVGPVTALAVRAAAGR